MDVLDKVIPQLRAAADLIVDIGSPTPTMLMGVSEDMGRAPGHLIQARLATIVQPDHLVAAIRPDGSAAAYLDRLCRIVELDLPRQCSLRNPPGRSIGCMGIPK